MNLAMTLLRILFGGWFAFWGIAPLFGVAPPPTTQPDALALLEANRGTFSMTLAHASFIIGGILTLIPRTAPLGLAVLAPTVAWIFLFHMTLTASYAWANFWLASFVILLWWHRDAYRAMIAYRSDR